MSHHKIRADKTCLNCGAAVPERYCSVCGQENIEPRQTVGHLVAHFFSDVTHFDGKFFITVKDLFRRPGFLSSEYIRGRRASYLDPVRMYIFTSALFFIVFFALFDVRHINLGKGVVHTRQPLDSILARVGTPADSAMIKKAYALANRQIQIRDSADNEGSGKHEVLIGGYHSFAEYDSLQSQLAPEKRDGVIKRLLKRKNIEIGERYEAEGPAMLKEWLGVFAHNFPKLLFFSLPAFALLLKLLYVRRKQFYYVDHGIFAIHLYIFTFLILLLFILVREIRSVSGWSWIYWLEALLLLFPLWYYYKAMRNFYRQSRFKTLVKYVLLCFLSLVVQLVLFLCFFLFSILEI